jgi:NAD(P)-dependent dehydrogenase (short-subunit alcohol dehydrogenase family)
VLVNNAGVMPLSRLDALRTDEWQQTSDVNLRSVLHGIAAVLPVMKEQGSGHTVNVGLAPRYRRRADLRGLQRRPRCGCCSKASARSTRTCG